MGGALASGGTVGNGGAVSTGGVGGAGGTTTAGAGGTSCTVPPCLPVVCLYGEIPNPNPCACPICAPPDAASSADAGADAPVDAGPDAQCSPPRCALPTCPTGYQVQTPPCGCPTCVPFDGGPADAPACPPVNCPAMKCAYGLAPNPDPCACPQCALPDAGVDSASGGLDAGKPACTGLDECTCATQGSCGLLSEACYCPYPQCGAGACVCGGGKFVGCVPSNLATCASAKARVAALCTSLRGATFDNLCGQTSTLCITKCLDEVTTCADVGCAFCEACDCMGDRYTACVGACTTALAQK